MKPIKVKLCGFLKYSDIVDAISLGVDYIGLNLIVRSPRCISVDTARLWNQQLITDNLRTKIELIALVDTPVFPDFFDIFQIYGEIKPQPGKRNWKHFSKDEIVNKEIRASFERIVFDLAKNTQFTAGVETQSHFADYESLRIQGCSLVLAGGLNPENITTVCKDVHPEVVDVASGLESSPGIKDYQKMKNFMSKIKLHNQQRNN